MASKLKIPEKSFIYKVPFLVVAQSGSGLLHIIMSAQKIGFHGKLNPIPIIFYFKNSRLLFIKSCFQYFWIGNNLYKFIWNLCKQHILQKDNKLSNKTLSTVITYTGELDNFSNIYLELCWFLIWVQANLNEAEAIYWLNYWCK